MCCPLRDILYNLLCNFLDKLFSYTQFSDEPLVTIFISIDGSSLSKFLVFVTFFLLLINDNFDWILIIRIVLCTRVFKTLDWEFSLFEEINLFGRYLEIANFSASYNFYDVILLSRKENLAPRTKPPSTTRFLFLSSFVPIIASFRHSVLCFIRQLKFFLALRFHQEEFSFLNPQNFHQETFQVWFFWLFKSRWS